MDEFFDAALLQTEYFRKYALAKEKTAGTALFNPFRNYDLLVSLFEAVADANLEHARSFAKRIKTQDNDWPCCEAVFAELIVYVYYLSLRTEGLVRSVALEPAEADVIVERADGTRMYLEILCIMPNLPRSLDGKPAVYSVKTHTQDPPSSIRQKLLREIEEQRQFTKARENYAVIELIDVLITGDFSVLSSLSDGYKVTLDRNTGTIIGSGYDWSNTFLNHPG